MAKKPTTIYRINGSVIDSGTHAAVSRLRVEAWDKDLIIDDLVGSAVTDKSGKFRIEFSTEYFKELFLDRNPDLYFKVFEDDRLLGSTENEVLWNVERGQKKIVIEVDRTKSEQGQPGNGAANGSMVQGRVTQADDEPL